MENIRPGICTSHHVRGIDGMDADMVYPVAHNPIWVHIIEKDILEW
jgi:hypothetical protein